MIKTFLVTVYASEATIVTLVQADNLKQAYSMGESISENEGCSKPHTVTSQEMSNVVLTVDRKTIAVFIN